MLCLMTSSMRYACVVGKRSISTVLIVRWLFSLSPFYCFVAGDKPVQSCSCWSSSSSRDEEAALPPCASESASRSTPAPCRSATMRRLLSFVALFSTFFLFLCVRVCFLSLNQLHVSLIYFKKCLSPKTSAFTHKEHRQNHTYFFVYLQSSFSHRRHCFFLFFFF